ncbi:hypothetical protein BCR44DRAFT_334375 [Catenaria anguillulae PL171]|uniref:Uncharacterized protein n=1 Tax=Catenaria anguillulae PL171 TaxID=765915 RepID=A0A1Y2HEN0_9FUNG|nr:hypothetical protein BCR44DRAFT_334375 [Catenaria anguillulae PL171]
MSLNAPFAQTGNNMRQGTRLITIFNSTLSRGSLWVALTSACPGSLECKWRVYVHACCAARSPFRSDRMSQRERRLRNGLDVDALSVIDGGVARLAVYRLTGGPNRTLATCLLTCAPLTFCYLLMLSAKRPSCTFAATTKIATFSHCRQVRSPLNT